MILSFALTKKEFLAGIKTETRRDFKPRQLRLWQKQWDEGRLVHDAVDKVLYAGGKRTGKFQLTARPYLEPLNKMTPAALQAEGGMCKTVKEFCKLVGKSPRKKMAVIKFIKL